MTHRQRVAAWRRRRTVRQRRLAAAALTAGWLAWWAAGAPAWTAPSVFGVVGLLLASASRRWREPVPAPDWQDLGPELSRVHVVRPDLFDREASS